MTALDRGAATCNVIRDGGPDGHALAGYSIRVPDAGEVTDVDRDRGVDAGDGDWREYGDIRDRERAGAAPPAGALAGTNHDGGFENRRRSARNFHFVVPAVHRPAEAGGRFFGCDRLAGGPGWVERRRKSESIFVCVCQRKLFFGIWIAASVRTVVPSDGRRGGRERCVRSAGLFVLAEEFWGRSRRGRQAGAD